MLAEPEDSGGLLTHLESISLMKNDELLFEFCMDVGEGDESLCFGVLLALLLTYRSMMTINLTDDDNLDT